MFKVSSIQYIYSRLHRDQTSQSQSISHLIISLWISTNDFWFPLLFLQLSVLFLWVQPHPLFSQFSCPLLSFSLSLWPSGVLESLLKSLTTARRFLNLSSRVLWAAWSLTSEPWVALRELRERTPARPRSFPAGRRGVVIVPRSSGWSVSLMTSHR